MPIQRIETGSATGVSAAVAEDELSEYPVREYIGAMALEMAQMARWASDEPLAKLLEGAAAFAAERLDPAPEETIERARRRPA